MSSDFGNIEIGLETRGFAPSEVDALMGGNWRRYLEDALPPQ